MRVVIIGGGLAGLSVLTTLARGGSKQYDLQLTLVEPKTYLEIRWASIRAMFDEAIAKAATIPLTQILAPHANATHVQARAIRIEVDDVQLDNGQSVGYDVCLVATGAETSETILTPHLATQDNVDEEGMDDEGDGDEEEKEKGKEEERRKGKKREDMTGHMPLSIEERREQLRAYGSALTAAESVLVVGGGPIGAELAADVAAYGQRSGRSPLVTLVQAGSTLVPAFAGRTGSALRQRLSELSVNVHVGQRARRQEDGSWVTESNPHDTLNSDAVFVATGVTPATRSLFSADAYAAVRDGWVRTDHYGRVPGFKGRVFAHGDCCDAEPKSGVATLSNRKVFANNIRATLDAIYAGVQPAAVEGRLKGPVSPPAFAIVTTGPEKGVAATPLGTTSLFLPWLKNKTMFLFRVKGEIGY